MTFKEALELKSRYHDKFVNEEGYEPSLTIAPRNEVEYRKWLLELPNGLTDEDAKKYCKDGNYWVHYKIGR